MKEIVEYIMKLYNIKARFIHDKPLDESILNYFTLKNTRYILREFGSTFTIYNHNKYCTHITGVKNKNNLKQCEVYFKQKFNIEIIQVIIDNQFYSHKDNKVLNMVKIYNDIKKRKNEYSVIFEPELFIAMTIRHVDRNYPTCLLYPTGSYTFLGGKMEKMKDIYMFIKYLIKNNTKFQ